MRVVHPAGDYAKFHFDACSMISVSVSNLFFRIIRHTQPYRALNSWGIKVPDPEQNTTKGEAS